MTKRGEEGGGEKTSTGSPCLALVVVYLTASPSFFHFWTLMVMLSNRTLFATLFEKDADYSIIKTFECLAYASTPSANRSKFDPRAQPCVFMGFPLGMKGYKLYDTTKKKWMSFL
ncbi:Retrovirus-related Pol polyprotein from transposon TNT 1-94 [Cucumis melo var. makuwa]|uniref:Retrovirus-related Pol polyprotein from transposon TNT 1-94 n=1 Tax=Cucumis melo var. makuwa TaxID=1194695 RepID=A0A5A7UF37_CUCMM|nr:Retrovirus-related Pol polyprotein from transposon TNT 1-94 [Cucumis melo var. makuwa]TYK20392.1 Retrovirus-related Pol polyprotein from transposon TNT 1-94 [Cucumis melo var. makuwa]